jgi:hypothetical protein
VGISTDQFKQRVEITHEVIWEIKTTKGKLEDEQDLNGSMKKASHP